MKVLVTGGRTYWGPGLFAALDDIDPDVIIHGNARGADYLAGWWARLNGKREVPVNANWHLLGKAAGPARNTKMLMMRPDLVVACPGNRGTRDCVTKAEALGIAVRRAA